MIMRTATARPTVWIVTQTLVRNTDGVLVPKFPEMELQVSEYGDPRYLLRPSCAPWNPRPVVAELYEKLATFGPEDFLVLSGDPQLLAMAFAVAALSNEGVVNTLHWSGRERRYTKITADLQIRELLSSTTVVR